MPRTKKDVLKETFGKDFVDLFIKIGKRKIAPKYQFRRLFSELYHCEEYVWRGELEHDSKIEFTHADGRKLPNATIYNQISGPGITFSGGEACQDFKFKSALVCPVEGSDLIYNFVDETSELYYVGSSKLRTIYVRIYDNNTGLNNDRWLVISIE